MRRVEWIILLIAAAALLLDPLATPPKIRLARDRADAERATGDFLEGGIDPTTDMADMPRQLEFLGSWTAAGPFHGAYQTIWYRAERKLDVLVAGSPAGAGSQLQVEVHLAGGENRLIPYSGANPGRRWMVWRVILPAGAERVRVRARTDRATAAGWFAFSAPVRVPFVNWELVLPLLKLAATSVLAWTLICGPGLAWMAWRRSAAADLALAILPGPAVISLLGALIWAADGWISGAVLARCGLSAVLAALAWCRYRSPAGWFRPEWMTVIGGGALIAAFAVAKANVSLGPPDELYGGTVSRTLEVGFHSDSRISYHVVQVAARHLSPFAPDSKFYFAPYSYGSRGPLAGWLATPLVLATGGVPPPDMPEQRWLPFDPQGFATYRIALIVLASLAGWAMWGVACGVAGVPGAQMAMGLLLVAPFFVHEQYFTWPKLISAACVLAAFHLLRLRRSWAAGLVLGFGYLFHPAVLVSAPFLGLWTWGDASLGSRRSRWWQSVRLVAGTLVCVLPWYLFGRWDPDAISQDTFLSYWHNADGSPARWATWWLSRWNNFANTFLPGYVDLFNSSAWSYNSDRGPAGGWVHYSLMYWTAFPFAVGLPAWAVVIAATWRGMKRAPLAAAVVLFAPSLGLIAYWGAASTGLMRQCGQVLFLSSVLFAAWALAAPSGPRRDPWARVIFLPWFIALRCVDLLVMAFASALQFGWTGDAVRYRANDLISLGVAAACLAGTARLIARAAQPPVEAAPSPL